MSVRGRPGLQVAVSHSHEGRLSWLARGADSALDAPQRARAHLTLTGYVGPLLPASFEGQPETRPSFGVAGVPSSPVAFDGGRWSGDAVCLSDWVEAETMVAWRAVIARGDFIQALCDETGGTPRITLQPVAVEQLATPTITPSEAPTWQGAATPHIWSFTSEGRGRLVLACDRRVGPDVPFEAWLEDQIADLEWGWDHPEAKGFLRSPWPKTRTLG